MNKKILSLLMFSVGVTAYSQLSFIYEKDDQDFHIQDGGTYTTNSNEYANYKLKNGYSYPINVKCEVLSIEPSGEDFQLCIGQECKFGIQVKEYSELISIPANSTTDGVTMYYSGDDTAVKRTYKFKFKVVGSAESTTVTYVYDPTPASLKEITLQNLGVTLHNTLVSEQLLLSVSQAVSLEVFDINGVNVLSEKIEEGEKSLDFSTFAKGIYVLNFTDKENRTVSVKVIKK